MATGAPTMLPCSAQSPLGRSCTRTPSLQRPTPPLRPNPSLLPSHPLCAQICEAFSANRYPFPEEVTRQRQTHAEVTARLRELCTTIEAGNMHRQSVLQTVSQSEQGVQKGGY